MEDHPTKEKIAQYVDALVSDEQERLSEEILVHVVECFVCEKEIEGMLEGILEPPRRFYKKGQILANSIYV
jgi:hypothetical protein